MNQEKLSVPSNEEMEAVFKQSQNIYEQEQSHYEAIAKEKPELAPLFGITPEIHPLPYPVPVVRTTEYVSGYFNINTYHQIGSYPFIQVSSYPVLIGNNPYPRRNANFNGYIYGGYNMPQINFNNIYLSGVIHHTNTIINTPLNFQLFIYPQKIHLRLFKGNVYLGDLISVHQHNILVTYPIVFSGVGNFNFV
ncbi:hypothetical protein [Xenorhabdus innexi]|uniref:Uncharacterized protein n=2 Tax=Xenorhabdus innexi TaxID=290109 RepID=A0A1N6MZV1_9GAMM|nr:hypothetical protein [Xenorhabdus innexi]PHM36027.1 hypothetical protein Xinn_01916 [Xenorhabdus innexi]SIP74378.1 conserved hypothetical protein [Xenorhabdus innexi]